jgi:hypothetical protein
MEATPLEHVVVFALATNCTFEPTVEPFDGLLTTTVANAGMANRPMIRRRGEEIFMNLPFKDRLMHEHI